MGETKIKEANASAKQMPSQPCDPSVAKCKSVDQPLKPRVGVVLAIYPILFDKNEYPKGSDKFKPVEKDLFNGEYFLMTDERQEVMVAIQVIDIDASKTKLKKKVISEGEVVIKMSTPGIANLEHKPDGKTIKDKGQEIRISVGEITDVYKYCFLKTTKISGSITITCTIDKPGSNYDFVNSVKIPPGQNWANSLTIKMRDELKKGDKGYDVMKLQWYLRNLGYYKKTNTGEDADIDGDFGPACERAIERLQRRANASGLNGLYRISRSNYPKVVIKDAAESERFTGSINGKADQKTIDEILKWMDKDWFVPLGRLGTQKVLFDTAYKSLRSDIVDAFNNLRKEIYDKGGILHNDGSTLRSFSQSTDPSTGRSPTSNHYCGIAIDIAQDDKLYYPVRDPLQPVGTNPYKVPFWRIYMVSKNKMGKDEIKGFKKVYKWAERGSKNPTGKDQDIPAGNYINLSEIFERHGFTSIVPHQDYEKDGHYNHQEWWHFHYNKLPGKIYLQDEVETISAEYTEKFLKKNKLIDKQLDNPPA